MQKLLIATTNKGKMREIRMYLSELDLELVSLSDVGITKDVEETGETFEQNSRLKAQLYSKLSGLPAISDDGGLEIEALGGLPGVHSKRWVGEPSSDEKIVEKMRQIAKELPDSNRNALFRSVVSFALPDGQVWSVEGSVKGIIAKEPKVELMQGFPYRSFFFIPEIGKYYQETELTEKEKKQYNHRYKAIQELIPILKSALSYV